MNNTIGVLGCGWYGMALGRKLAGMNRKVHGSTTSPVKLHLLEAAGIKGFLIKFDVDTENFDPEFFKCDTLIISLPPGRSSAVQNEYPEKIRKIAEEAEISGVKKVVMISSTSVYGDVNKEVNESAPLSPETDSGKAIVKAEEILRSYKSFQTTILRFGGLIGPGRNLAKFFAGKKDIPNGLAPVNLIHLEDCLQLTLHILDLDAFGYVFNACSPDHPTRKEFYTMTAQLSNMQKPEFLDELNKWKQVNGNQVTQQLNFKYLVNNWSDFLSSDKL